MTLKPATHRPEDVSNVNRAGAGYGFAVPGMDEEEAETWASKYGVP